MNQRIQFLIFFAVWTLIVGLGYAYVGWRLIGSASIPPPWEGFLWLVLGFLYVLPLASFATAIARYQHTIVDVLAWIAYTDLALMVFTITLLLARDIILLGAMAISHGIPWVAALIGAHVWEPGISPELHLLFMRLTDAMIFAGGVGMASYGIYEARKTQRVKHVDIMLPSLPREFDGFRIVQITDVHVGLTIRRSFVESVVDRVNELNPDLIAFTGDIADGTVEYLRKDAEPFKDLRAQYGAYFVTGNHEYYSGADAWVAEVRRLGLDVLMNEHRIIRKGGAHILLAGVPDISGKGFLPTHASLPAKSLEGAPETPVRILMAHQPKSASAAADAGFDLMLSGHTHGGQFFPWNYLVPLDQPYVAGLHRHGKMLVYVSRGTGYWGPPVRLAAPSEITVLTLRRGKSDPEMDRV